MPTVARLNVTPVKSTALHHPGELRLEAYGAAGNRDFYFVDDNGRLQGGSKFGPFVQIESEHDPETERLSLRFPDGTVIEGRGDTLGDAITTDFWGRPVPAHVVDGPWSEALSEYVARPVRLVRTDTPGGGYDVHPATLVSEASVAELGRRAGVTGDVDARRFRMLFDLAECGPHEEDTWIGRRVRIGEAVVRVPGPVPRCVVTTMNPVTGERDLDTLRIVKSYRGLREGRQVDFGIYGDVEQPGRIRVGDAVAPAA
jgi:uncharacterized protein YcbX